MKYKLGGLAGVNQAEKGREGENMNNGTRIEQDGDNMHKATSGKKQSGARP